ncbi:hypothetical protein Ddc_10422 [Ditylenchus destructor]|nr:hypothetical protein Ddc_10422 [Ditylenchus destructor]
MAFRGKIFALREQTSKNAMAKQNVAQDNKENVAVPESVPFDSSVRGPASGHGRGSHTGGFQNDYGQKAQDPPIRQEGHDFGDLTASKFGNYARGGNVRGIPRGGGMTRDVNNQNDYGPKAQDSPSRQEGQDFGDSTAPKFGNYTRGNGRGSSRGYGMARDFNSEIPKETPAIQKNEFAHDMNQNIVTRGAHFGRGRGESFAAETAKEAPVMQPFSSQNEVPRGGLSNVRGSRGGRGGIRYGEDASGRAEPPVVSETVKEAPASQITTPVQDVGQNGVARGGFGNSRGGGRVGYNRAETVKEAPASQITTPVQDVGQNGVARGGFGNSRGGGRVGYNRGEDLPGYNPPVDASYGRPLTLPQAQSGEKREGSSDKVQPWHISTSVGQTPLTQPPPVTVNGGAEIKSIFKKAVSQAAAKEHGDDVHISKADFANLAHLLNEMATSFNTLNAFLQQLVKKF